MEKGIVLNASREEIKLGALLLATTTLTEIEVLNNGELIFSGKPTNYDSIDKKYLNLEVLQIIPVKKHALRILVS